jgi:hypothetical protein
MTRTGRREGRAAYYPSGWRSSQCLIKATAALRKCDTSGNRVKISFNRRDPVSWVASELVGSPDL